MGLWGLMGVDGGDGRGGEIEGIDEGTFCCGDTVYTVSRG